MQVLLFINIFYMAAEPPSSLLTKPRTLNTFDEIFDITVNAKLKMCREFFQKVMLNFEDLDSKKKDNLELEYFKLINREFELSRKKFKKETRAFLESLDNNSPYNSEVSEKTLISAANIFERWTFNNDKPEYLFFVAYRFEVCFNIDKGTVEKIKECISEFIAKDKVHNENFDRQMQDLMFLE